MEDRIIFSLFLSTFVIYGILCIIFPEMMFKTTATNTLKKKPTKLNVKTYKIGGYFFVIFGVTLIIITLFGGFGI